jgi:hypothetical protein
MIYKLNSESPLPSSSGGCDLSSETSDNKFAIDADKPGGIKEQVANYIKVMTEDFKIPEHAFFNTIPINISHLVSFIKNNSSDVAATRLYLAKKSDDPAKDDYELLFVPCKAIKNADNQVLFYEDKLNATPDEDAHIVSVECRKPPGCQKGAGLLPPGS